ncbi:MAG: carboxylating nicotinate-nucleotide diphosphorylase [Alphaproteobacteria bacterium]|nr:carboxylating nicotinate-nucleotide diphosphorylase [Alphaproteobacteria bacterium]
MTKDFLLPLIRAALAEDIGTGDITSELLIPADLQARMAFVARQELVLAGAEVPGLVYSSLRAAGEAIQPSENWIAASAMPPHNDVVVKTHMHDGQRLKAGTVIATVSGPARAILTGERTALNLMQRMSGVATLTRKYVDAVAGTKAKILDTRKTMPGLRLADKYAVRMGGGMNHRMGLYDAVLVKDNHIGIRQEAGSMSELVKNTRTQITSLLPHASGPMPIFVECDTLEQVAQAIDAAPDRIMLDNMSLDMLREAVALAAGKVPLEATGGVTLSNVRDVAETGVDYISVGAITHSAPAVDIALDVI